MFSGSSKWPGQKWPIRVLSIEIVPFNPIFIQLKLNLSSLDTMMVFYQFVILSVDFEGAQFTQYLTVIIITSVGLLFRKNLTKSPLHL